MTQVYTAGQLALIIQKLGQKEIAELGNDDSTQKSYIYNFMNLAMMKLARLANQVVYSDALNIAADGNVTFQVNAADITNLFEPSEIFGPTGQQMQKRYTYDSPIGWYRDGENTSIHIKGFSYIRPLVAGNYTLKYIKYPKLVTIDTDTVQFPPSGYMALVKEVLSLIKTSGNEMADAQYLDGGAKTDYGEIGQAAMSAKGTGSTGQPISAQDVQVARGG